MYKQPKQPEHEEQVQGDGLNMEENNVTITGPPASRTVIDNLKKLLLQRQHSRESDTEVCTVLAQLFLWVYFSCTIEQNMPDT